jgi:hypothetical protein
MSFEQAMSGARANAAMSVSDRPSGRPMLWTTENGSRARIEAGMLARRQEDGRSIPCSALSPRVARHARCSWTRNSWILLASGLVALVVLLAAPDCAAAVGDAIADAQPMVEIGARVFVAGDPGIGTLGASLEGVWMHRPHYGFGVAFAGLYVDNGADPYYSASGTLDRGIHGVAFAEGDLLRGWITPYARVGLGAGRYDRFYDARTQAEINPVAVLEGGAALRIGPLVVRVAASPSLYGSDFSVPFSAQLGARF